MEHNDTLEQAMIQGSWSTYYWDKPTWSPMTHGNTQWSKGLGPPTTGDTNDTWEYAMVQRPWLVKVAGCVHSRDGKDKEGD